MPNHHTDSSEQPELSALLTQTAETVKSLAKEIQSMKAAQQTLDNTVQALVNEKRCLMSEVETLKSEVKELREVQGRREASEALRNLCCSPNPAADEVRKLVEVRGAMVTAVGCAASSPLHRWAKEGRLELVKVLLETTQPIMLHTLDEEGNTPFHAVLCGGAKSDEEVRELMGALVERLEIHLEDIGEHGDENECVPALWEVRNAAGHDVLHLAIATGHLSVVYPLLKDRPHYGDLLTKDVPLLLDIEPSEEDWMKLRVGDRDKLQPPSVTVYKELIVGVNTDTSVLRRCIRGGANLSYVPDGFLYPTLHYCVMRGYTERLEVLLDSPRDVDFTQRIYGGLTPLHYVLHYSTRDLPHPPDVMVTMTSAIVRRLAAHPKDLVDWGMKDDIGRDFLSLAAREGVLSHLYPLVKHQPYYVNAAKPLELQYRPDAEDWALLSDADRSELRGARKQEDMSRRVYEEVERSAPSATAIRRYIIRGADPLYRPVGAQYPTLHRCALSGKAEVLIVLLETERDLDFTLRGLGGRTPLHCVCDHFSAQPPHSRDVMVTMTSAIVRRLAAHPKDLVDWRKVDDEGRDFLSLAAREGVVSHLYPLVKHQPNYVNAAKPLVLGYGLGVEDQDWVNAAGGKSVVAASEEEDLNRRLRDAVEHFPPDLNMVSRLVDDGGNVLYRPGNAAYPTLHRCIMDGHADSLKALLKTPRKVDFTVRGRRGRTPLHCVCEHNVALLPNTAAQMKAMTATILDRLADHPEDTVDWGAGDRDKHDFLSYAAREGVLSDLYPLVKDQPYYVNAAKPLVLTLQPLNDAKGVGDWDRVPPDDRWMFWRLWES